MRHLKRIMPITKIVVYKGNPDIRVHSSVNSGSKITFSNFIAGTYFDKN